MNKVKQRGAVKTRTETVRVMLTPEEDTKLRSLAHKFTGGNSSEYIRRVLFNKDVMSESLNEGKGEYIP